MTQKCECRVDVRSYKLFCSCVAFGFAHRRRRRAEVNIDDGQDVWSLMWDKMRKWLNDFMQTSLNDFHNWSKNLRELTMLECYVRFETNTTMWLRNHHRLMRGVMKGGLAAASAADGRRAVAVEEEQWPRTGHAPPERFCDGADCRRDERGAQRRKPPCPSHFNCISDENAAKCM